MPELPEIEIIKIGLISTIINRIIIDIKINTKKLRYSIEYSQFKKIKNKTIKQIIRKGKHLIIFIENNLQLIIHLGMSGNIRIVNKNNYNIIKHDYIIIELSNNVNLVYNDPRRFGYWILNNNCSPFDHKLLKSYGVDPLSPNFNNNYLFFKFKNKSLSIKQLIMNKNIIAGIGNIYANEILFHSNIFPTRLSNSISKEEINKLVFFTKKIIKEAITHGGTTIKNYKNIYGNPGFFNKKLYIYKRVNQACYICSTKIERIILYKRSTFFCRTCQQ